MKVIFAGFSKCGTKSMAAALTELGYSVHDFAENYEDFADEWMQVFDGGETREIFYEMYKDIDAVTDLPCCFYWKEIHEAFPDAKVKLSSKLVSLIFFLL